MSESSAMSAKAKIDVQLVTGPVAVSSDSHSAADAEGALAGAECTFVGRTRAECHPEHGKLVALEYEAHASLALQVFHDLADQAAADPPAGYGCLFIRIHHSIGRVDLGEPSVVVQVRTPHRSEAFTACRFLIDELKKLAPIWKREIWQDGRTWVKGHPVAATQTDQCKGDCT